MAAGSLDLVDCVRLAEDSAVLQRVYDLEDLPRLRELLAERRGSLRARLAFATLPSGRAGADVTIEAEPQLVCQRCLQGLGWPVATGSAIEFAATEGADSDESPREFFVTQNGEVSLRDLAEEELLLAVPMAPVCAMPLTCGRAPSALNSGGTPDPAGEMRRPFSALQDLLRKT
jgi:uncharacterized protein